MADVFDTLKKHSDRVSNSASKSKKVKRDKTRPWHDFTINVEEASLDEQIDTSKTLPSSAPKSIRKASKTSENSLNESPLERKQIGNNTESIDYVNKSDYVINSELKNSSGLDFIEESINYGNNTESIDYVNKSDYVIISESKTRLNPSDNSTDSLANRKNPENTETIVYVNKSDYVNNTLTNFSHDLQINSNNTESIDYVNNTATKRDQSGNNTDTVLNQSNIKTQSLSKHYVNDKTSNTKTNTETILLQKSAADLVFSLSRSEEKILQFIVELCLNSASLTTPKITYRLISNATNITAKTCKTLIGRLKTKKILMLESYTKGPGSYSIFSVPQEVYNKFLYISGKSVMFDLRKQNVINTEAHTPLNTETNPTSKLVSNLNNTNNTKPYDFSTDDLIIEDLRMLGIPSKSVGDSIRNLNKYLENNKEQVPMTKEDFQDFINKFVEYANSEHGKTMKSKSAIFIGEVQKYQKEGTCSTLDWHNDKEYEIYEKFVKEQELKLKRRSEMLEKAVEFKFHEWKASRSREELLELVPEGQFSKFGHPGYELELKKYFRDNLWDIKKNELG